MLTGPQFSAAAGDRAAAFNLRNRLEETPTRIATAALRSDRAREFVRLIAVSTMQPATRVQSLAEFSRRDFAENNLQGALPKLNAPAPLGCTSRFLGQLQTNKTRTVAEHFLWMHTLDRERISVRLNEHRPAHAPPSTSAFRCVSQMSLAKAAASRATLRPSRSVFPELPRLKLRELMRIPPRNSQAEGREPFSMLAGYSRNLISRDFPLDTLSIGMSADLEAAVAASATAVRVGTAIFGERPSP